MGGREKNKKRGKKITMKKHGERGKREEEQTTARMQRSSSEKW